jgi:hypothetical protein
MEYTHIAAAVPQGEHFDATAINEGVWLSQAHLMNVENILAANAATIAANESAAQDQQATITANADAIAAANQTIADRDASITTLQTEVANLKAAAAHPLHTTTTEADNLHDSTKIPVSEVTMEANRLRAIRDGKAAS